MSFKSIFVISSVVLSSLVANMQAQQCPPVADDGFRTGPCCTMVLTNLPTFPAFTDLEASYWRVPEVLVGFLSPRSGTLVRMSTSTGVDRNPRGPKSIQIRLSGKLRSQLKSIAQSTSAEHGLVLRSKIVLLAVEGLSNAAIGNRLGCHVNTARTWRHRFAKHRSMESLADEHRSGRPPRITPEVRCDLLKLACSRPEDNHASFRETWTLAALQEALEKDTGERLSISEIGRILRAEEIRPHRIRYWLHSPDPDFKRKVKRICSLYLKPPEGATVLCVDEKTCMQALDRKSPLKYPKKGQEGRFEYEYRRKGTCNLIAAFEPTTGKVFGRCSPQRKAKDLLSFMRALAKRYSTGEVYVIWDNLNIHHGERWREFNEEQGGRFHFVHTPVHASWVNQIEIWFGILQRRILRYGIFDSVASLTERVKGFIKHWNRIEAHPFRWTFRGTRKTMQRRRAG